MGRDALSELLHEVHLLVVAEEREVAAGHELHGHLDPSPDVEQGLDELVRRPGVRRPALQERLIRATERRRGGGGSGREAEASMSEYFHCIAHSASR